MKGVWYIPHDVYREAESSVSNDADFYIVPQGIVPGEQFRSFCFWLGFEGENL